MTNKNNNFDEIREKRREIEKIRQLKVRKVNEEIEPLYKALQDECAHEYIPRESERVIGYMKQMHCWHCNHSYDVEYVGY